MRELVLVGEAADLVWITGGLEVYLTAVDCGWADDRIVGWLAATLAVTLLADDVGLVAGK